MSVTRLAIAVALCFGLPFFTACNQTPAPIAEAAKPAAINHDQQFDALARSWLSDWFRLNPISATQVGSHIVDGDIEDLSVKGRAAAVEHARRTLAALEAIDATSLSRENQIDYAILRNQLQSDLWSVETLQNWAWDPQVYGQLAGSAIYTLMAREFAPLPERLKSATLRIEKLPRLFSQARENLDPARVPLIHAETAAKQHGGILGLVDQFITPNLDQLGEEDRERAENAIGNLKLAVAEQQKWLDETLVPNAKGDFRIGAALYDQKLAFALNSPLSRGEIKQRAEAELQRVRAEMYSIARTVLADQPKAPEMPEQPTPEQQQAGIAAALELAYADRPDRDKVVETATASTERATAFVREKGLVTLPESPVKIILMPEFQRGVAVAYCDSPGPLDKHLDTFYAVSPIPDDWSTEQVDSFLREYNTRSIEELSIHEAMPGHFLQIAHSNKHPSTLRAVLSSGSFVEGWAVYAEKMMVDAGYLDNDPLFKLINLKWYLRVITNALMDQAIHVDGMTREDAMTLMTVQGFQQEREAAGKWVRAQLTSTQLPTYFVGFQEHLDLEKAIRERDGDQFDMRKYNDTVLSFGSPPGRYVRQMMLKQPIE
ncbi:MAG TPA: DUF885 domain-containing protein [Pseudomonadota bacterium]|nr:DUF885 domain-containing protein [Xanthomonadales bacterium]HQW82625.1 DUF885 domain-containing protein [Pseudomonadota bacterium]